MQEIIIHEELKNLLPPLPEEEAAGLEESIVQYGCLTPIVVWNNILVDGHYRYEICTKHGLPFSVTTIFLDDLDAAKLWAWQHQANRRNLTPYQRAELALKFKDGIAAKAKERQRMSGRGRSAPTGPSINTATELANLADVSHDTIHKVEYIVSHADEEAKKKLRRGEKGTSIHKEYSRLKSINTVAPRKEIPVTLPKAELLVDETSGNMFIRTETTTNDLAKGFVEDYSPEFVREFIHDLLKSYDRRYGTEAIQHFLLKTCSEWID